MKKHKLKQWYPSLPKDLTVDRIVTYKYGYCHYENESGNKKSFGINKAELFNTDFWELIEEEKTKPLFITEDGEECFDGDEYISIGDYYNKIYMIAYNCDAPYSSDVKRFFHESNADKYIWKNKRVFSYNDLRSWDIYGGTQEEALKVAKKRSEK